MSLRLYCHPLASFCQKALIALYENETPFERTIVDLGDAASRAAFEQVWPLAKMPVLRDEARGCTVAEATIVIEYLDAFYPGPCRFIPASPDLAWRVRLWDRFFDLYVQEPMQKVVLDRLRPEDAHDATGVEQARTQLCRSYAILERELTGRAWPDNSFTLVDCAAAPALLFADVVSPIGVDQPALSAYLRRLVTHPSVARALREAEPYFSLFPLDAKPRIAR
jgi:glutathione S-transferase